MKNFKTIVVAYGDGIGPEIMDATLAILKAADARIDIETIELGEKVYSKGELSGIPKSAWDKIFEHKVLLKAPITTPQGKGYKSLNVTFRKTLGLYANIRPCTSYYPFVGGTVDSKMDLVICRENEEDLYAGIEYRPTEDTAISHKLITRQGSYKIIKYAFEYARNNGRKKVTCMIKDNIMKIADGMFADIFKSVAAQYPQIAHDSIIIDIGAARIASNPKNFDVVVTLNLYGDIISDIAAEVSGSVGLAGSSNIGDEYGMFEAVHGSAPDIAGKGIANPSGLLNGAILMLEHIKQFDVAEKVKNAWLKTIEDGIHTVDIFEQGSSKKKASTSEFAKAVIENLGQVPSSLKKYMAGNQAQQSATTNIEGGKCVKKAIGFDVAIDASGRMLSEIAKMLDVHKNLKLHLISERGLKIWPSSQAHSKPLSLVNCRYIGYEDAPVDSKMMNELLAAIDGLNLDITAVHKLYTYDDKIGFTMAQGE